jgi:hypothetical protein
MAECLVTASLSAGRLPSATQHSNRRSSLPILHEIVIEIFQNLIGSLPQQEYREQFCLSRRFDLLELAARTRHAHAARRAETLHQYPLDNQVLLVTEGQN